MDERAALFVAQDLLPRLPDEGRTPYLAPDREIAGTPDVEPVPPRILERMREITGLPVATDSMVQGRDSTMIMLYLFRPLTVRPDSVRILAGWIGLTGGDGGSFWAHEYDYLLDCTRACVLRGPPSLDVLN